MSDGLLDRVIARSRETSYKGHSPAYRWLREHHARLAPVFASLDPPLGEIAAEMASGGLTGGRGKPLTAKAVMRIWRRVCRDLEADAAARECVPERVQPSRLPPTWRPTSIDPPRGSVAPRAAPAVSRAPPAAASAGDEADERVRAQLASLQEQFDYVDRYVRPPKRKA